MAHFNSSDTVRTYEGAKATAKTLDQEWTNMIFSSFLQDGFYEDQEEYTQRIIDLNSKIIKKYGTDFAAKAMYYVRNILGMRTTSALLAAQLNGHNFLNKRECYSSFFRRPDDISEVFAAIDSIGEKRSHALIRGAADYLSSLSDYSLGKYKMKGHKYNLYDLINLTHAHSEGIQKYKDGTLATPETWEVEISTAVDDEQKAQRWRELVIHNKLGYLAFIRNLRNFSQYFSTEELHKYVVPQLVNKTAIRKSLIFPYQIYNAYKAIRGMSTRNSYWDYDYRNHLEFEDPLGEKNTKLLVDALNNAFIYSVENVPAIDGDNLVIVDVSGSMDDSWSPTLTISEVSCVYAAAILLRNFDGTDVIKFGTKAKLFDKAAALKQIDNVFEMIYLLRQNDDLGYGTNINTVTPLMNRKYDSIFLFSDMQVMRERNGSGDYYSFSYYSDEPSSFYNYFKKYGPVPVFSFDLGNYHTRVSTGYDNIYPITALSANVFDFISLTRNGKTLVDVINSITLT